MPALGRCCAVLMLTFLLALPAPGRAQAPPTTGQAPAAPAEPIQSTQPQEDIPLDEVSVVATKTRRDTFQTPGEVNVIPRSEFDRAQAINIGDVLKYQPGVDISGGPRTIAEEPIIRGLTGPRILVDIDGARLNYQFGHKGKIFIDVDLLKQVDIARGPSSALYGSNALGGVVSMTTIDAGDMLAPSQTLALSGKFGWQGAYQEFLYTGTAAARLPGNVEVLASFSSRNNGDISLSNGTTLVNSAEDVLGGIGKVTWRPTPVDNLTFSILGTVDTGRVPLNTDTAEISPFLTADRTTEQFVYRVGYSRWTPEASWLNPTVNLYYTPLYITEKLVAGGRTDKIDFGTYGIDARNSSRFSLFDVAQNVLTYGVEYYHDSQTATRNGNLPITLTPDGDANTVGLYVQDEVSLWKNLLVVIPGLRWDYYRNSTTGQSVTSADRVSPKVGVLVNATDFLILETSYAQGFRAPNFGELFVAGSHFPGAIFIANPDLKPETSQNVEVGFRVKTNRVFFGNDRFQFRNAYFWNHVSDFIDAQIVATRPLLTFQFVNVQNAHIRGYEAELLYEPLPNLFLLGNYTNIVGTDEKTNQPLGSIPAPKLVLGADYRIAPIDVTFGGRTQIVWDKLDVAPGFLPTPGYTVYDLYAYWTPRWFPGFRLDVGCDNVTDKRYRRSTELVPEPARNPKVTVSYTWKW